MTTAYTIPVSPGTPQTFQLALAGVTYTLTLTWNWRNQAWNLDIADVLGNDLVTGIPVVTGCDLLGQFAYLGFGGTLVAQTTNDQDADEVPTFTTLGDTAQLYFVTEP
jgi:hypothetical protein